MYGFFINVFMLLQNKLSLSLMLYEATVAASVFEPCAIPVYQMNVKGIHPGCIASSASGRRGITPKTSCRLTNVVFCTPKCIYNKPNCRCDASLLKRPYAYGLLREISLFSCLSYFHRSAQLSTCSRPSQFISVTNHIRGYTCAH